jgi:single-strand selective monofunctional uracil DNA glycosylase
VTPLAAARALRREVDRLGFGPPVAWVYNPLGYARASFAAYLSLYARAPKRVVFLGLNPGPWGMAQTGVPFGEVESVRGWLGIQAAVGRPAREHPGRPVLGFGCTRSEVSGRRLWGLMQERFGTAADFFREHFVANYCPLLFLTESGANLTPDKLPAAERGPLFSACDEHLGRLLAWFRPEWVVGVGRFAESRLREVCAHLAAPAARPRVAAIPHPSPASPAANRGWAAAATRILEELGIWR